MLAKCSVISFQAHLDHQYMNTKGNEIFIIVINTFREYVY